MAKGLKNKSKNKEVANQVILATSFFARLKGLLGTDKLDKGSGLFLKPCKSIHMFGMRYSIDAVFLNDDLLVIDTVESIAPGKASKFYKDAKACLELPTGTIKEAEIEKGDSFEWIE